MHAFNNAFEGHVEHCCLCFPIGCGAHFLGFVQAVYAIMLIYSVSQYASISALSLIVGLPLALFFGYPAFYYFKMLCNSSKDNREDFAKAYKCYGKTSVLVYIVLILLGMIYAISAGVSLTPFLGPIVGCIIQTLLVGHYVKVVHEYAHRAEDGNYNKA